MGEVLDLTSVKGGLIKANRKNSARRRMETSRSVISDGKGTLDV